MKKTIKAAGSAAAIAAMLFASAGIASAAGLITTNASFETADVDFTDGYAVVNTGQATLTGWNVGGEGVDIVGTALWQADEGERSIDLNAFHPGSVSVNIPTVPGQTYNVTFAMSGNPDGNFAREAKTMTVTAAAASQGYSYDTAQGNTADDMKYAHETFSFAATGTTTTLTFTSTTTSWGNSPVGWAQAAGPVIDNVNVEAAPNVVKTKVWNTWTGGPVSSTTAPDSNDPAWHPTSGDPQSALHKSENHKVNEPYFVPKGKSGGAWFMWSEVETVVQPAAARQATFTVLQPKDTVGQWGNVWTHVYTVTVASDGTFTGTGSVTGTGSEAVVWTETITGKITDGKITFNTVPVKGGATFAVTDAPMDGKTVVHNVDTTWGYNEVEFQIGALNYLP